jgi:hypothetical protein
MSDTESQTDESADKTITENEEAEGRAVLKSTPPLTTVPRDDTNTTVPRDID